MIPDLARLAAELRSGRRSAVELARLANRMQAAIDPELRAWRVYDPDTALRQAQLADDAQRAGADLGPLQGIPVSVKDLYGLHGFDTCAGSARPLPDAWCREGPVVGVLRRQLAIMAGKTHTVEFAFGGLGVNSHWGTPRNPWDGADHRVAGGSSIGAGISLCEGSALVALGTDTAGSVRIPASMTGTVGLKTTKGHWSTDGIVPLSPTLDSAGVLARTVADAAWAWFAIEGLDSAATGAAFARLAGQARAWRPRLGMESTLLWQDCQEDIVGVVEQALVDLEAAGMWRADTAVPECGDAVDLLHKGNVVSAEIAEFVASELPEWRDHLDPLVSLRIRDGGNITASEYLARQRRIGQLTAAAAGRFEDCDVIVSPTVIVTPPKLAEVSDVDGYRPRNMAVLRNTCAANTLGLCALTLPAGLDDLGLPVGLQLLAPNGAEERLLAAGLAIENVLGTAAERLGSPAMVRTLEEAAS